MLCVLSPIFLVGFEYLVFWVVFVFGCFMYDFFATSFLLGCRLYGVW